MGPLAGRRVAVLRAAEQGGELAGRIRAAGGTPVPCPIIAIAPPASYDALDAALAEAGRYDWIVFTSANSAAAVAGRVAALQRPLPARTRLAAIGPATAVAMRHRFGDPELVAAEHTAAGLASALVVEAGARVLLPAGNLAGSVLPRALEARGARVDVVTAYRTVPDRAGIRRFAAELTTGALDAAVFTSGSTVRFTAERVAPAALAALRSAPGRPAVVCIGPSTAAAARECGLSVDAVAEPHTTEGVMDALGCWFAAGG